jgi:hypothetical protein
MSRKVLVRLMAVALSCCIPSVGWADTLLTLSAGTYVYAELDEQVTSRKKDTAVGDIVRARVWRDVVVEGRTAIRAGTPVAVRVSSVKPAKMAGRKGEVFLDAISTTAVDGSAILLDGGYDKSGKGKKALAWSLFALVAWPLVFLKGKQAVLDPGTVFDSSVQADSPVTLEGERAGFALKLSGGGPTLEASVLYDDMDPEAKQEMLPLSLKACGSSLEGAAVVSVNEHAIPPIPLQLVGSVKQADCVEGRATVNLKLLAKHFTKGINRFEVGAQGLRTEIILEIEL